MSKAQLSVVGLVHTPKNEKRAVAYVQMMNGDKKAGAFIRADYIAWLLANPAAAQAAITSAESQLPKPAPVVAAPVAVAAPAAAVPAGFDPSAMMAMMQQWQQMQAQMAALGISAPAAAPAPVAAPVVASTPAPAVAVKAAPLSDANAARVRAIAKR